MQWRLLWRGAPEVEGFEDDLHSVAGTCNKSVNALLSMLVRIHYGRRREGPVVLAALAVHEHPVAAWWKRERKKWGSEYQMSRNKTSRYQSRGEIERKKQNIYGFIITEKRKRERERETERSEGGREREKERVNEGVWKRVQERERLKEGVSKKV